MDDNRRYIAATHGMGAAGDVSGWCVTVLLIMIWVFLSLWLVWCLGNLALMAIIVPKVPAYTGFRIVMPEYLHQALTINEYCAVLAHEQGHQHYRHAWWNYACVCVFWFPSKVRLAAQEIQADDYAVGQGCALALATALRKLSHSPMDWVRADRLEEQDWAAYLRCGYATEENE